MVSLSSVTTFADSFYHGSVGDTITVSHSYPYNYYSGGWWIQDTDGQFKSNTSFAEILSESATSCRVYIKSYDVRQFNLRHHYNTYNYITYDYHDYNFYTTIKIDAPPSGGGSSSTKLSNPMKVTSKNWTVKAKDLKKKKKAKTLITVKNAQGKVTYKKVKGSSKLSVSQKTGRIIVKKKTKKGTYTIKVKVRASGNSQYKARSVIRKIRVKVK